MSTWQPKPITPEERADLVVFGNDLRDLRAATGLSQYAFGELVELSGSHLCNLENGHRRPRASTLARIGERTHAQFPHLLAADVIAQRLIAAAGCGLAPESTFKDPEARRQRRLRRKEREREKLRRYFGQAS